MIGNFKSNQARLKSAMQILIFFQPSGKQNIFSQDSDKQNAVKNGIFMEKSSQFLLSHV